jgi:hypothetical protein
VFAGQSEIKGEWMMFLAAEGLLINTTYIHIYIFFAVLLMTLMLNLFLLPSTTVESVASVMVVGCWS